jgi:hypothetical protein
MKLASFDIELATPLPENNRDKINDAEISCAAIALEGQDAISIYAGDPVLSAVQSNELVNDLRNLESEGYRIVTWNGCGFDFPILANHSEALEPCSRLALSHHDLMLLITFQKGWYLALDKALGGAGLQGKLKEVSLSNGTILDNMDGAMAPELWLKGERKAVIEYLKQDVRQQLELGKWVEKNQKICWTSNSGNPWSLPVPKLYSVKECFDFPLPDVSWMDNPPQRADFVNWMPAELRPNC